MANQYTNTATKIDWDSAVTKKHIKEAEAFGLELLGPGRTFQFRNYRFNNCGHKQEITSGAVRRNSFRCWVCFENNIKEEAKNAKLIVIGEGTKKDYRLYQFEECGHKREMAIGSIRNHEFKCIQCGQHELQNEAKKAGLTLVREGRNHFYRTYLFDACGHVQEITPGKVRKKQIKCRKCETNKFKNEAESVGLLLIGAAEKSKYRLYQFKDCKHKQELQLGNVRSNNFICNTCEETARDLPSKVYLLKITVDTVIRSITWLKLGYAKSVRTRMKQYGLPSDAVIERLKVMDFETGRQAHLYEASLHKKYKHKRLSIKKMEEFHTKQGSRECYPLEMLDTLMKELEAKEKRMKKQQEK